MAQYYDDWQHIYSYTRPKRRNNAPWMFIDPQHSRKMNLLDRRRARGKVTPKKGAGKRSKKKR